MKDRDKYLKFVEWSEEDQCYVGRCPELFLGGVHGGEESEVYARLVEAVDDCLASSEERPKASPLASKTFSGKFLLRMDPAEHKAVAIRAHKAGVSLNDFAVSALMHASP